MESLLQSMRIVINEEIYVKDPESSDLGRRIVEGSIAMIDEMGFENFTFKKLGVKIGSNESSIYRYFENKHKLLLYLTSWYWGWIEYQLVISTHSIKNGKEKLLEAIQIVTKAAKEDSSFSHINEVTLNKIVINEYSKSYLTKEVDDENKQGYFVIYKRLVKRLSEMIIGVNSQYKFPFSLASTVLEAGLHQHFLKEHFTSITDCDENTLPTTFLTDLVFKTLENNNNG